MSLELSHQQTCNRLLDIQDELERLNRKDTLDNEDETHWADLMGETVELDAHRRKLERADDLARARMAADVKARRGVRLERGSDEMDKDPIGEPDSIEFNRSGSPWDLSEMRMGLTRFDRARELHTRALDAIEQAPGMSAESREVATRIVDDWDNKKGELAERVLALSDPDYLSAFMKIAPTFNYGSEGFTDNERAAFSRAMSLTDAAGGFLVPFQLDPNVIMTSAGVYNDIRMISRKVQAVGDVWNGVSAGAVAWSFDAEAAAVSDDAPTFAQPSITVRTARGFVPISLEAFQDAANVTSEVGTLLAEGKDILEATVFITGAAGSNQPIGLVTALTGTASVVASATTDTFAIADVYNVYGALPGRHRRRASWLANNLIYSRVRQFDTQGGAGLWTTLGNDRPPGLIGRDVYEAESMDGTITALADNLVLIFGDFSNYVIADRIGMTVEFIPNLFDTSTGRPTGQKGWFAYYRVGADSVNDDAFRMLNVT